jgi:hypothetical protein
MVKPPLMQKIKIVESTTDAYMMKRIYEIKKQNRVW